MSLKEAALDLVSPHTLSFNQRSMVAPFSAHMATVYKEFLKAINFRSDYNLEVYTNDPMDRIIVNVYPIEQIKAIKFTLDFEDSVTFCKSKKEIRISGKHGCVYRKIELSEFCIDSVEQKFVKPINRIEFLRKIIVGMLAENKSKEEIERYVYSVNKMAFVEPLAELEIISVIWGTFEYMDLIKKTDSHEAMEEFRQKYCV